MPAGKRPHEQLHHFPYMRLGHLAAQRLAAAVEQAEIAGALEQAEKVLCGVAWFVDAQGAQLVDLAQQALHALQHPLGTGFEKDLRELGVLAAESHDQALVGDKSIAFWLMDKEMYFSMSVLEQNLVVDRGIALHKLIRMITLTLGGEGYLNFIGNEFGHPEWVDFPRLGNDWSYQYARRQWSLVDTHHLRYRQLDAWDKVMIHLATEHHLLSSPPAEQLFLDPDKKILAYTRGGLIFVFSFHPTESYFGFPIRMPEAGTYHILFSSDEKIYGGFERLDKSIAYPTDKDQQVHLYVPNRVVMVMGRKG